MENFVSTLENKSLKEVLPLLKTFIEENESVISSPKIDDSMRERLWEILFKNIQDDNIKLTLYSLRVLRILTRERKNLPILASQERLKVLLKYSCINDKSSDGINKDVIIEGLKCLCNITYNYDQTADILLSLNIVDSLVSKISSYNRKDTEIADRKSFEIKLLFLITAFSLSSRIQLHEKYGLTFFSDIFHEDAKYISKKTQDNLVIKLCCDLLKTAFNVVLQLKPDDPDTVCKETEFRQFVATLRELLLIGMSDDTMTIISDTVNLLTLAPIPLLEELMVPGHVVNEKKLLKSPALEAMSVMVDFLDAMLIKTEEIPGTSKEELSPILVVLINASKSNRFYRKFIRARILPNLKEVHTRPEVGSSLRNKLCRLLTCPLTQVRDLVADLLFLLCKESVGRMVKYTGYGNAAGLFANRGLLGGSLTYSSDSEDSETEEYIRHKDSINPVVGCVTPPRTDPLAEMSEEQKEYLAMELVNKIDRLQREGVIQPCRVGPDGRPQPIDLVHQFQQHPQFPKKG